MSGKRGGLVVAEEVIRREEGDKQEAENELWDLLREKLCLVSYLLCLSFAGPINGVGEDNEPDHRVARGLDEDGELAGRVGVERSCGGGLPPRRHAETRPKGKGGGAHIEQPPQARQR